MDSPENVESDTQAATERHSDHRLHEQVDLDIEGISLSLSVMRRNGAKSPILFLHGYGATKEDYADAVLLDEFNGHAIYAYDAPGAGRSTCDSPGVIDIPFLQATAERMVSHFNLNQYHLVGHSMGGLTALLLANAQPESVLSFTNIEGNLAPEDCFLSRQVMQYPTNESGEFFDNFVRRLWHSPELGLALYAERVRKNVQMGATQPIFRSMIELSDFGNLLEKFIQLQCPKLFIYGEANRSLSYLDRLRHSGVVLNEIPLCSHFPMYSNPPAMWDALAKFIRKVETSRESSN